MARFTVFERQIITYAWEVEAEDEETAQEDAYGGVPDGARTVQFSSENWAEAAPSQELAHG